MKISKENENICLERRVDITGMIFSKRIHQQFPVDLDWLSKLRPRAGSPPFHSCGFLELRQGRSDREGGKENKRVSSLQVSSKERRRIRFVVFSPTA